MVRNPPKTEFWPLNTVIIVIKVQLLGLPPPQKCRVWKVVLSVFIVDTDETIQTTYTWPYEKQELHPKPELQNCDGKRVKAMCLTDRATLRESSRWFSPTHHRNFSSSKMLIKALVVRNPPKTVEHNE